MHYHIYNIGRPYIDAWWLRMRSMGIITAGYENEPGDRGEAVELAALLSKCAAPSQLDLDQIPNAEPTYREGAVRLAIAKRYDRSAQARSKCIEIWGLSCHVCGFNFEEAYGSLGVGYIHVHHLTPLHTTDGEYDVDPKVDLRPVCANCHAMLHRTLGDVISIEELARQRSMPNQYC